jgi:hypothetical protein
MSKVYNKHKVFPFFPKVRCEQNRALDSLTPMEMAQEGEQVISYVYVQ